MTERMVGQLAGQQAGTRLTDLAYNWYTRRMRRQLAGRRLPRHIGLIMDGNRRWARQMGMANLSLGHRYGAEHVDNVLAWCESMGIKHVTVFLCSTENLTRRGDAEVAFLMEVIEQVVAERLTKPEPTWQVQLAGLLDVLPDSTARALKDAADATRHCRTGAHVTLAVGYGGRQEIVEALRELLHETGSAGGTLTELAGTLTEQDIAGHLYTAGRPDPELVIRTSGEQRLSNFLLWQSAYSQLHFCEAYWPAFREIDFLRALRNFARRAA
ncbi:MAG: short-chain Z-isoprenyl diphosphate synthase [Pseudonocardiales bacterium]|nr:short-chain Z-isoprenyl diphosphate synthase [Pseudonocardiales bacterium]